MRSIQTRRSLRFVAALSLVALAGCLDTTATDEEEPQIAGVVLAAAPGGAATGSLTVTGGQQAGTLTLQGGVMNALEVRVLGPDFKDEPIVMERAEEFEIRLQVGDAPLTSTISTTYPYQFSVLPEGSGAQAYVVVVRHIVHGNEFLGEANVTVVPAGG